MARVINTLGDAIDSLNFLYNGSSTSPTSGEEDYLVWTGLINLGINIWENEEGMLWKELFTKLSAAATGDKTTDGTNSYDLPTDFRFPNSAYVWLRSGNNKQAYQIINIEDIQLFENNSERWCYFTNSTLEFNPNLNMSTGETISYNYYKDASLLDSDADVFEMADPGFAVYYALSELKKEEGDTSALTIATQKLDSMKTVNEMGAKFQDETVQSPIGEGMGI